MVKTTHLCKYYPLKTPKLAFIQCETLDMQKDNTLIFLQMGQKHLDKTYVTSLNVCDDNIQDQGRL